MGSEWKTYMVREFADVVGGGTPKTRIAEYWNGNIPWLTPKDLSCHHELYISHGKRNISEEGLNKSSARLLPPNTVLLTSRAPVGYVAIAENEVCTNQGFRNLIVKEGFDFEFVYYMLSHNTEYLKQHASGSTFQELSGSTLKSLEFLVPPLPDQRAIAHILGSLDDKIELNRQMNRTLEAIAQAIFKSWFVAFDPVRAKAEGRDPGLPKDIADLFPDSFEDSELGEIPKGWKVSTIGDVLELIYGKALKASNRRLGTVPVYGSNGRVGWHDEKLAQGPGIVIGRKGNPGIVTWVPTDFFPIDTTFYVAPKDSALSILFLFYALQGQNLPSLGADSAVPGLNRNMAYMNQWVIPPAELVRAFDNKCFPFYGKIQEYNEESLSLTALRDTLLPKLLSGELRVPDYEKLMGDIA